MCSVSFVLSALTKMDAVFFMFATSPADFVTIYERE
jgi:hypothetical protein